MAWVKVPSENHPIFQTALPKDPRVETVTMFGGIAAKVNGNMFAGLFGRSTMIWLPEPERARALALEGASLFDPMGNGSVRSDKVMLPESMMTKPVELRRWLTRAFEAAAALPPKAAKPSANKPATERIHSNKTTPRDPATKKPASAKKVVAFKETTSKRRK